MLDVSLVSLSYVFPSLLTREAYVRRQASLSIHAFPSLLTRGAQVRRQASLSVIRVSLSPYERALR